MAGNIQKTQAGRLIAGPPEPDNRERDLHSRMSARAPLETGDNMKSATIKMTEQGKVPGFGLACAGSCHELDVEAAQAIVDSGSAEYVGKAPAKKKASAKKNKK